MRKNGKSAAYQFGKDVRTQFELRVLMLPAVILILVFNIAPLAGLTIAFTDFNPIRGAAGIFTSNFNHFRNFKILFTNYDFLSMLKNTVGINLLSNLISIPVTLLFSLFLNEIQNKKFKSLVQTVTYMPHFLSWVVYGGLFITLLSTDNGFVNTVLISLGLYDKPVSYLGEPRYFWWIAAITALLKEMGWGAILYLAAIVGVDQEMYESAMIDGAGRFRRMWYITIPSIQSTIMIMIIFALSGIFNNNFTQIYVLQNTLNIPASQVLDTYIYKYGMQQLQFGVATAVGLAKSVMAVILLWGANKLSNRLTGSGLF